MTMHPTFLGLARPPLQRAVEFLLERYVRGRSADMSEAVVVLPGRRAARRLMEILVARAEEQSLDLQPPDIETVGHLPERLYRPKKPFATDFVQQLAWAEVLRQATPQQLAPLLPSPPAPDDDAAWLELGGLLFRQHTELAADFFDFVDVAKQGADVKGFREGVRWEALGRLQAEYLRLLDSEGLWDIQTARRKAVDLRECTTERSVFLVGAVDISVTLRRMLDQVAEHVTPLIFAPQEWAERFDHYGCLIPEAWESVQLAILTDQVHVVDGPAEQAEMAARCLAGYRGQYRPDEITIGLADEQLTPHLQRQLQQCRLASRSAAGLPLAQTAPYRLLAAVAEYLQRAGAAEFAALVRHPDVYEWIDSQGIGLGWLEQLESYSAEHLQAALSDQWLGAGDDHQLCRLAYRRVEELVAPLRAPAARSLAAWNEPIRELLLKIYGDRDWDRDDARQRVQLKTFEALNETLDEHGEAKIPPRLMPTVMAADGLRLTLQPLQGVQIAAPVDPEAIELLGWLELPWDDAPALVVTTFNEGHVPSSINSDLFLPNALRSRLGLQDNARRYARDAYALSVLLATRQRLDLIVARRNGDGDPLAPSRLLFAADAEVIARRVLAFFPPPRSLHELPPLAGRLLAGRDTSAFPVPRPAPLAEPIDALRVTAFRDYLACPYRFYLRHVLHLQAVREAAEELDGAAFGGLLHAVLDEFGRGPCRASTDPEEIRRDLNAALDRRVTEQFGGRPLSAVFVQREQLRARLTAFANQQAAWAAAGWRIEHTEVPAAGSRALWEVDGEPFYLRGRMDRIDVHRETGQRFIFDYKSSDSGKTPEQVHQRGGDWIDLQLPLYRHLAQSLGIAGTPKLGYILLPKDTAQVQFREAEWTEADLAAADEVARGVVRNLRDQKFWPPTEPPPDFSEDFAPICQDGVFEKGDLEPCARE